VSAPYRVELLGGHDRAAFVSGQELLDRYIWQQATQDVRRGMARVYVLVEVSTGTVAGYYTLSNDAIEAASLPSEITKRFGRYPSLPATLLGRLALDRRYQARKIGGVLLRNVLRKAPEVSEDIASCGVVVDAIDDAARALRALRVRAVPRKRVQTFHCYGDRPQAPVARVPRGALITVPLSSCATPLSKGTVMKTIPVTIG